MESRSKNLDIGSSLIENLGSSGFAEALQDIAEVALDSGLMNGIAKDIPVIGTIVHLGKAAVTIRDYFLVKKVLIFLGSLGETTSEQRQAFAKKIEADPKHRERVGEAIMLLLDRYDHLDKASLMAKVFCACIREEIDYNKFLRISTSIDRAFIEDLRELCYFSSKEIDRELKKRRNRTTQNLYTSNFSDFYVLTKEEADRGGLEHPQIYHFNQLAVEFAKIILGDQFQDGRW